jgi:heterodisulfide reductase subunit B
MHYGYYPGCSMTNTARPYEVSTRAIAGELGLVFDEVEDWNCCGATEYMALNKTAAYALIGRNLALAEQEGMKELVAPCSACYLNLRKTDYYMKKYKPLAKATNEALAAGGLHYKPGSLVVRHLLDVVVEDVGYDAISAKVTRPLTGLRVAPYYGCLIVRPELDGTPSKNTEYPTHLDHLMEVLGAEVVDFPLKTHCCGGHMTQISADTAYELIRRLLQNAADYKADMLVTLCPMCQFNLDAYQSQVNRHFGTDFKLPVLYFTQMIGLAMGLEPKELAIGREITSAADVLRKIGTTVEIEEAPPRRKRDDKSLPMPRIREG